MGEERSILIRHFRRCVWRRRKELEMGTETSSAAEGEGEDGKFLCRGWQI
jgi:hypothetical protein